MTSLSTDFVDIFTLPLHQKLLLYLKEFTSYSQVRQRNPDDTKFVPTEAIRIVRFRPKQLQKITSKEHTLLTLLNQGQE